MLDGRIQGDYQGIVLLPFDLRMEFLLLFIDVKGDGCVAVQFDPGNFLVVEKPLLPSVFQQFLIRLKAVDAPVQRGDALNGVEPDLLRSVFVALDIPDPAMKRDDMRFKGVFSFFAPRIPVNEADGLFLSPGVEDLLEYLRINARVQLPEAFRSLPRPSSPANAKASFVCP